MPKMHFLLSCNLLCFPPKKAKCVLWARRSRQQIGLKAIYGIHHFCALMIVSGTFSETARRGTNQDIAARIGKTRRRTEKDKSG